MSLYNGVINHQEGKISPLLSPSLTEGGAASIYAVFRRELKSVPPTIVGERTSRFTFRTARKTLSSSGFYNGLSTVLSNFFDVER